MNQGSKQAIESGCALPVYIDYPVILPNGKRLKLRRYCKKEYVKWANGKPCMRKK
jgi:hypothetical protein